MKEKDRKVFDSDMEENELVSVAMEIILHAGDARTKLADALNHARKFDFESAKLDMDTAHREITLAHNAQTEIIQNEASGICYEFSLLFAHAQDTLMTINSEVRMTKEMIEILKLLKEKMK